MDYKTKTYYMVKGRDIIDKLTRINRGKETETNWDEWELEYGNISEYLWKRIDIVEEEYIDGYLTDNTTNSIPRCVLIKDNGAFGTFTNLTQSRLEVIKEFHESTGLGIESYLKFMETLEGL